MKASPARNMDTLQELRNDIKDQKDDLRIHAENDKRFQDGTIAMVDEIKGDIKVIRENHLAHIQVSIGKIEVDSGKIITNVDWLMRYHWIIASASLGALVVGVIGLMVQ